MMTLIIPRKEAPVSGEGTVVIPQPAGDEPVIKTRSFSRYRPEARPGTYAP